MLNNNSTYRVIFGCSDSWLGVNIEIFSGFVKGNAEFYLCINVKKSEKMYIYIMGVFL
uniref:Uncharacterized protein n=1 Tax=uncultured bacterium contig00070 TaxID=1181551 RepID=A0A806KK08_9BACT|nr:hypothetical protein [uncultured bacterium contig00070]